MPLIVGHTLFEAIEQPEEFFGCAAKPGPCLGCRTRWTRRQNFIVEASALIAKRRTNIPANEVVELAKLAASALEVNHADYDVELLSAMSFYSNAEGAFLKAPVAGRA